MKVSYKWLKDFIDIDVSAEDMANKLTISGLEVEDVVYQNAHLHDVYVGLITKIEKHPNAEKLQICHTNLGDREVQIITSATNVFEGAHIPVALDGADLVNGVKIKPSNFRGVQSEGMFCSGEELGIDENYIEGGSVNGILILPEDMKPGAKIEDALLLNDVMFDINVTPNRPDCNSVIGIARDLCAIYNRPFKDVDYSYKTVGDDVNKYISVDVKTKNCPRYMAAYVKNLKLERSPLWLRARLNAVGIKPINTIVDITNYVLIEQGQPMHAFDYQHIGGKHIIVRQAKNDEEIAVLNGNTYKLSSDDMVIADSEKPIVIAGIIGGTNSCVQLDTTATVFECAVFDLKSVRLTSKKIGVATDSSIRYSKNVYITTPETAIRRALNLVYTLGCGEIVDGIIDTYNKKAEGRKINVSMSRVDKILGIKIERNRVLQILNSLGIESSLNGDVLSCVVPSYREDIEAENDIAEELIRIYGYDVYNQISGDVFENSSITIGAYEPRLVFENSLKNQLVDDGFYETLNYSLYSSTACDKLLINDERKNVIKIANPINEDLSTVRTVMAHALLLDIKYNLSVGNKDLRFFETGKVYLPKKLPLEELPEEKNRLSIAVCEDGYDFYMLKRVIENLLVSLPIEYKLVRSTEPYLHPGVSADIVTADGKRVGYFGKVHKKVLKNYGIGSDVYYGELDTDYLSSLPEKTYATKEVSKFSAVERDIAIVVDSKVTNEEILSVIKSACGKNYVDADLFDVYKSESLGEGKISLAYKIHLMSEEKTLTSEELNAILNKVIKSLQYRCGATLRA